MEKCGNAVVFMFQPANSDIKKLRKFVFMSIVSTDSKKNGMRAALGGGENLPYVLIPKLPR